MVYVVLGIHLIVCVFLIIVVLLQSGQAADLAGAFGGMGSQTVFGPRGSATVLSKATTWAAIIFMLTSLVLAVGHKGRTGGTGSVIDNHLKTLPAQKPAAPPQSPVKVTPGTAPAPSQPAAPTSTNQGTPPSPTASYGILKPGETAPTPGSGNAQKPAKPAKK